MPGVLDYPPWTWCYRLLKRPGDNPRTEAGEIAELVDVRKYSVSVDVACTGNTLGCTKGHCTWDSRSSGVDGTPGTGEH